MNYKGLLHKAINVDCGFWYTFVFLNDEEYKAVPEYLYHTQGGYRFMCGNCEEEEYLKDLGIDFGEDWGSTDYYKLININCISEEDVVYLKIGGHLKDGL
jgi:hypothetical protein